MKALPKLGNNAPIKKEENSKPLSLTEARKQLNATLTAQQAGYAVPIMLVQMFQEQVWRLEGVVGIWSCQAKDCSKRAELFVKVQSVECGKHGPMKQTWSAE